MSEREKVKVRIFNLLQKTEQQGSTVEEAAMAAEKAGELMEVYDIQLSEIQIKNQKSENLYMDVNFRSYNVADTFGTLAAYCDCCYLNFRRKNKVLFYGFPEDLELVEQLANVIEGTAMNSLDEYKNSEKYNEMISCGYHGKSLGTSFMYGFNSGIVNELNRLIDEKYERRRRDMEKSANTGTNLVSLKNQKVEDEYEQYKDANGIKTKTYRKPCTIRSGSAYRKGVKAASNVNLTTGINSHNNKRLTS